MDELAQHGRIARPYIGASLIDKDISARYGFDLDLHGGIFVMKIVTGGPVYNAGMRPGDIILTFDGAKVETVPELRTKLAEKKVGLQKRKLATPLPLLCCVQALSAPCR